MSLPSRFEFHHKDNPDQLYFAVVNCDTCEVSWNHYQTGAFGKTSPYSIRQAEDYIERGVWVIKNNLTNAINTNSNLHIGQAREALLQGKFVARQGWNGENMYLFMIGVDGHDDYWTFTNGKNDNYALSPFVAMKTSDDKVVPWLCSQTDFLSEDYYIVDENNNKVEFKEYDKFEFIIKSDLVYVARRSEDRKRYIVMWKYNGKSADCTEYTTEQVKEYIERGTWKITKVEIE